MRARILAVSIFAALFCLLTGCSAGDFGLDKEITVITREDGSGTRDAFIRLFDIFAVDEYGRSYDATVMTADTQPSTGVVIASVTDNKNAIGYISVGALCKGIKALSVNGAAATAENVKNGSYNVARTFNIATLQNPSSAAADFIAFLLSAEGQAVVEESGYISAVDGADSFRGSHVFGTVTVSGSSSVAPVMQKLKEAYETINPHVTVEVNISDSSTGVSDAANGSCDIGMTSRELKDSELSRGLVSTAIALDGIAIIVNPENSIDSLSPEQIKAIYTGQTSTWSEVIAYEG